MGANERVEAELSGAQPWLLHSRRGSSEGATAALAQIRACAAWARRDCFCSRARCGRVRAGLSLWRRCDSGRPSSRACPARPQRGSSRTDAAYATSRICAARLAPCLRRSAELCRRRRGRPARRQQRPRAPLPAARPGCKREPESGHHRSAGEITASPLLLPPHAQSADGSCSPRAATDAGPAGRSLSRFGRPMPHDRSAMNAITARRIAG